MIVVKYVGIFLACVGGVLAVRRHKQNEGLTEEERKQQGSKIKVWQIVVLCVLGFLIVFCANLYGNLQEFAVDNTHSDIRVESSKKDNKDDEEVNSEKDDKDDEEVDSVKDDKTEVEDSSSDDDETTGEFDEESGTFDKEYDDSIILMSDDSQLTIDFVDGVLYNAGNLVISVMQEDLDAMYYDSFVEVGNKEEVMKAFEAEEYSKKDVVEYAIDKETTVYVCRKELDGYSKLLILQDVGAPTYLTIEVTDFSSEVPTEELIETFYYRVL